MRWAIAFLLLIPAFSGCFWSQDDGDAGGNSSKSSTTLDPGLNSTSNSSTTNPPIGSIPGAPRNWTEPGLATIRPGASLNDGSCTANFIFTSLDNVTVYIGTAAHCFSRDLNTQTNGCLASLEPLGSKRSISGASKPGTLVYSSWLSMQAANETSNLCNGNDFALLQIDPEDEPKVSPAMWRYGGPTGLANGNDLFTGARVLSYGNSGSRPQDSALSAREGVVSLPGGACSTRVTFPNPAIPGDSGSPVILATGLAVGDFVSIEAAPLPGQGHVCLMSEMLSNAADAGFHVRLATWAVLDDGLP